MKTQNKGSILFLIGILWILLFIYATIGLDYQYWINFYDMFAFLPPFIDGLVIVLLIVVPGVSFIVIGADMGTREEAPK